MVGDGKAALMAGDTKHEVREGGPYIGRAMPRFEDRRFVRGAGRYTDDIVEKNQTVAIFVRSPHAHARINGIDISAALEAPGVVAVLTGGDYVADGLIGIPQIPNPADVIDHKLKAFAASDTRKVLDEPHLPLAVDRVRYVGEAVAVVIAETVYAAKDAAELVDVDYEVLPAVTDVMRAIEPGAPVLWPAAPDNIAVEQVFGERDRTLAALDAADLVVERTFRNQRIATMQMEPRSAIGSYDPQTDSYLLIAGSQSAHRHRQGIADCLRVPQDRIRTICPDTGGGFGSRTNPNPELIIVVWAAKRVGRPVKWTSDRSEAFLTDFQGRDMVTKAKLGVSKDGKIQAFAFEMYGGVGGQTVSYVWLNNGYRVSTTVYDVPLATVRVCAVMTNTVPTAPFRGAGRPESHLVIEGLLDMAAARLGMDRVAIRRKNLVPHRRLPYRTAFGLKFDSGDFRSNMDRVLVTADWAGFAARRRASKKAGKLRGIGVSNYVESPVGAPHERVDVKVQADGTVELTVGTQSTGQGHETSFAQVMADKLGVHPEQIRFVQGDTAKVVSGGGTHSDRSMRIAGMLMVEASEKIVKQASGVAAALLDAPAEEIVFEDGLLMPRNSNRRLSIVDVAKAIDENPNLPDELRQPLASTASFTGRIPAYPTGATVVELEIDPETGVIDIQRYTSLDDAGQPINPLILHGQVHGGIAQGVGQVLVEGMAYDADGQVLTGSLMDYGMPRATMFPDFTVDMTEDPTHGNPLRVKGGGESGITPSLAVMMSAIADALSPYGIEYIDMPITPSKVWAAIEAAKETMRSEVA